METNRAQYTDNKKERIASGFLTLIISGTVLAFIILYKTTITTITPPSYININFETDELGANYGTDPVGLGEEEPADQDVLLGSGGDPLAGNIPDKPESLPDKQETKEDKAVLSNPDSKETASVPSKKAETKKATSKKTSSTTTSPSTAKNKNTKQGTTGGTTGGNPKGNAAVGNLLKGKGTSTTSTGQGTGGKPGQNQGVESGGSGSGGVGIGNGRNLIKWIPGTNGKSGKAPDNNCTGTGTVVFSYTVNKNGDVISVERSSGSSNTCMVNAGKKWIKQYVKAEKATNTSTGSYKINF